MNKTIVLAVDAAHHGPAAADMVRELSRDSGDRVIVLHVHEFAVGRFGRLQVDCPEGDGERLVAEIVDDLKQAGVTAEAEIREANYGHVARQILEAADQHDARMLVLGSHGHADLPLAFGSVAPGCCTTPTAPSSSCQGAGPSRRPPVAIRWKQGRAPRGS